MGPGGREISFNKHTKIQMNKYPLKVREKKLLVGTLSLSSVRAFNFIHGLGPKSASSNEHTLLASLSPPSF